MDQDARSRFIAHLHHVWRCTGILKCNHQILGVCVHGIRHRIGIIHVTPAFGDNLLARIRPDIAVMDINEKPHARRFDFLGKSNNVVFVTIRFGIMTTTACRIAVLCLGRNERAQANGVETVIFQNRENIAFFAIDIVKLRIISFVFLDFGNIGAIVEINFYRLCRR